MNRIALVTLSILLQFSAAAAVHAQPNTPGVKSPGVKSPGASYLELHKRELAARSYTDLYQVRSQTSIAHDKPMSKEELSFIFPLFKATLPREVIVTSEQVNGTSAILRATAAPSSKARPGKTKVSETTTGEIELTLEKGQWKIEHEKWDSKIVMK